MRKLLLPVLFFAVFLAGNLAYGQQEKLDVNAFEKIRQAELSDSHIPYIAHYLTDVAGPRLTGSPGFKRAAEWTVATMKQWGLINATLEPWGEFGKQWELQDFSLYIRKPYSQPLRAYAEPWSYNTKGTVTGGVVVIPLQATADSNYFIKHSSEFAGKFILLTLDHENTEDFFKPVATRLADTTLANMQETYMISRAQMASYMNYFKIFHANDRILKQSGALALIEADPGNVNGTVVVQAYYGYKTTEPATIPRVSIAQEDALRIKRDVESGEKVELSLNLFAKTSSDDTKGYNVIAEIPGSDPSLKSQVVMLGGHLDSWEASTGATDNAAGCIVMMEAVRLLDSLHLRPKRTIRIALWSGEEQGLLGSINYVKNHFINGQTLTLKPEQSKVSVYFNLDNGTGKIRGIYAQDNAAAKVIFDKWFVPFHDLGATTVTIKNTGSTDHLSFDWAGIPGFEFIQDPIDYDNRTHHSNMDDYDHLQIDDLKQAAIIVASFVYQASNRPEMFPRKPVVKEKFIFDGF
jgi:carboxypeptidase Q